MLQFLMAWGPLIFAVLATAGFALVMFYPWR